MDKKELLKSLEQLGFPLMETNENPDANEVLAEVVKSNDFRLWEGFPVLLANVAEEDNFDYERVLRSLNKEGRKNFELLVLLSLALYQTHGLRFSWANQLKLNLSKKDERALQRMRNSLVHNLDVDLGENRFDPLRLKQTFHNYFEQNAKKTRRQKENHEELSLEYSLSQLFSPKQKELFNKRLKSLPLTKTEKEYYSRTVKKKVAALANPELHRLSQKLMDY